MTETALQIVPENQVELFDTSTPELVIDKAKAIAVKLTDIVEQAKLYSMISNRKYVKVEGWTTMLAMLGVFPHVEYCRKLDREVIAYEARVVLRTINAKAVGSGEALCTGEERNWSGRDEFAIKSMAQTRATGKAARNAFSWIMALAGYEATPAEEMVGDEHTPRETKTPAKSNPPKAETAWKPAKADNQVTTTFALSDQLTAKSGNKFWKALGGDGNTYFVWEEFVYNELKSGGNAERTVEIKKDGKFVSIVDVKYAGKGDDEVVPF